MKLPVLLRTEASAEFDEGFDFYDRFRAGLGRRFVAEVERVFDRISEFPGIHPIVLSDVRKAVVRRFPYCVFYRPHSDRIEVLAVFCTRRNPAIWRDRI